jgi:hypothetical protein
MLAYQWTLGICLTLIGQDLGVFQTDTAYTEL